MKILLSVDGSAYTQRMLDYITTHSDWLGKHHRYTVLHVVPYMQPRAAAVAPRATIEAFYRDEIELVLGPVRSTLTSRGIESDYLGKPGNVADVICHEARDGGYDLVVMGSHGHGNFLNLVMGSVATKVLGGCNVPVLLLR